jgi:biotin carboxyl carrier protein
MKYRVEIAGQEYEVDVERTPTGYVARGSDGEPHTIRVQTRSDGSQHALTPWGDLELTQARRGSELWLDVQGRRLNAIVQRKRAAGAAGSGSAAAGSVHAPMPGKLLRLAVAVGDRVSGGQALAVIEAMKMENEILAPLAGVVRSVAVSAPCTVEKGALLVELEPT